MNLGKVLFFIGALVVLTSCSPISTSREESISDGPYITHTDDKYVAEWVCNGKHKRKSLRILPHNTSGRIKFAECGLTAEVFLNPLSYTPPLQTAGDFPVVAFSDIHGQLDLMLEILRNNKVIDSNDNWAFGNGHMVITGDIFDRGGKVTEALWYLYGLERQAEALGGRLHLLLGNHEVMILNNDLRYLHPKYEEINAIINKPFSTLFSNDTVLGKWIRSKPVVIKVNDTLFMHGGLHPSMAAPDVNLQSINKIFKDSLVKSELTSPRTGMAKILHESNGPIWYRGYFRDPQLFEDKIDALLDNFEVNRIAVGHTSQERILQRFNHKVIAIDSSIKNGVYGELLFIEEGRLSRGTMAGDRENL